LSDSASRMRYTTSWSECTWTSRTPSSGSHGPRCTVTMRPCVRWMWTSVALVVDLRPLAELLAVLHRERREAEDLPELRELLVAGGLEIEPEELAAGVE